MASNKDIFDLLNEQQHKLAQPPSPRAWRRLERRLDNRRVSSRHDDSFKPLAMVAAIALIAVFAFLMMVGLGQQNDRLFALNSLNDSNGLEKLSFSDTDFDTHMASTELILVAQHAEQQRNGSISEGTALQKLVPSGQNTQKEATRIPQFDWLNGKWQSATPDNELAILESWSASGTHKLVGTARKDGQLIEKMQLEEKHGQLYFGSDFGTGHFVEYSLKTLNQREAVFENLNAGFPEQIVLKKLGPSRLAIIYRNAEIEAGNQSERIQALQKRHMLSSQQAVRYLSRLAL